MPPEATITACARSVKSPITLRDELLPRSTLSGSSTEPLTPSTAPFVDHECVDAVAKPER